MKIHNRQRDALPADITLDDLGKAMSQLDISSIPPEKRQAAVMDQLMHVMATTIRDPATASSIGLARSVARYRRNNS